MTREELMTAVRAWLEERKSALRRIPDETALDTLALFPAWRAGENYAVDERVRFDGKLYRVVQAHASQTGWEPPTVPALFTEVAKPGEIPEWEQPESTNPYAKGDKVKHNGSVWVSDIDGNVWEPGVYGWTRMLT